MLSGCEHCHTLPHIRALRVFRRWGRSLDFRIFISLRLTIRCLRWSGGGVRVKGSRPRDGFAVGRDLGRWPRLVWCGPLALWGSNAEGGHRVAVKEDSRGFQPTDFDGVSSSCRVVTQEWGHFPVGLVFLCHSRDTNVFRGNRFRELKLTALVHHGYAMGKAREEGGQGVYLAALCFLAKVATSAAALVSMPGLLRKPRSRSQSR